jgi:hypothetical protein
VQLCWRPRKVQESCLLVSCVCATTGVLLLISSCLGMILACSFYSLKEVQGYKMLAYGVTLLVEEPGGLGRALSGGDVAGIVEAWCRYFWYYCYVLGMGTTIEGVVSVFRCCSGAPCHS